MNRHAGGSNVKKGILIVAACLLAASCVEEGGTTPGPEGAPEATSPANVLKCVEISFNQTDIKIIVDVLSDGFVFYFDPDDVGQNPPGSNYVIPVSWSCDEFKIVLTNMYRKAFSISLSIPTGGVGTPDPNKTIYKAENVTIKLLVMIDELNGYLADCGYCNFEFERYDGPKGEKLWRLTKWWDNTGVSYDANPGVSPTSVGRVFALFY
jgi:hypothetical protein